MKNIDSFYLGRCYWGRKKVVLSAENIKIEVELTEKEYIDGTDLLIDNERSEEW